MKLTQRKATVIGYSALVLFALIFIATGVIMFEPVQDSFLDRGLKPSFLGTTVVMILIGILEGLLSYLGFSFTKFGYMKWQTTESFRWKDFFLSSYKNVIGFTVLFLLIGWVWILSDF